LKFLYLHIREEISDESVWKEASIQSEKSWLSPEISEDPQSKAEKGEKENLLGLRPNLSVYLPARDDGITSIFQLENPLIPRILTLLTVVAKLVFACYVDHYNLSR